MIPSNTLQSACRGEVEELTNDKILAITSYFEKILEILGLDLTDPSLKKTPERYAKMLVNELIENTDDSFPVLTFQSNHFGYKEMLIETNITLNSLCEHHFIPIIGYCHIAYIPRKKIIGLSKLNRIAQYFAKRPQVQERLTCQICEKLCEVLETEDVAVVVDALHLCVRLRGVKDHRALTRTSSFRGKFEYPRSKQEFLAAIPRISDFRI